MLYPELRGKIRARFKEQSDFARAINRSPAAVSNKLNGKTEWTAADIRTACEVLEIPVEEIPSYFFYTNC